MNTSRKTIIAIAVCVAFCAGLVKAEDISLLPKYGGVQKNAAQVSADQDFIKTVDDYYKGDRKKAAEDISLRAWQFLRQGNIKDAMRRFNQAWLLDNANGHALWGMAAVQANTGKAPESLELFSDAERSIGEDLDFSADYAKALGLAGAQRRSEGLLKDAFSRFARVYERAPEHVPNLQNWAITLFYIGNYSEAWNKIELAEATPRGSELDQKFIAALQSKMPRP